MATVTAGLSALPTSDHPPEPNRPPERPRRPIWLDKGRCHRITINGAGPTDRPPTLTPLWTPDGNDDGSFSGLQFQREIPDEASAEAWFRAAWGQNGILPPCPRCGWDNNSVAFTSTKAVMPYRCRHCKKDFSIKIRTVMSYSPLRLRTWLQALLIWTEGDSPSSSDELERRMGLGEGTGSDVNWRILTAATEDPERLDEDCVLVVVSLGWQAQT